MRAATVLGVIVGGVTFGFTGFAFALFAISALVLEFPPAVVVPAVMLVGDTLILMLAWEQRASLLPRKLRHVPPFSPWSAPFVLAGLAMGTLLLSRAPAWTGRLALGTLLLAFTLFQARRIVSEVGRDLASDLAVSPELTTPSDASDRAAAAPAAFAGLAAGLLDGWLGTGGVAIVVYLAWRRFPLGPFVAGLRGYFLASDVLRMVVYAMAGYWSRPTLDLYLRVLPWALLATLLGVALCRRWGAPTVFRIVVLVVLFGYGVALITRVVLEP